jgi:hypothetical protein
MDNTKMKKRLTILLILTSCISVVLVFLEFTGMYHFNKWGFCAYLIFVIAVIIYDTIYINPPQNKQTKKI